MHTTTAILSCLLLCPGTSRASETDSVRGKRMQEVEVRARATQTLKDGRDGRLYWQMESLESLPHVLGSSDPVRALQLLPGVATNNDYTSGIRIQGCEASQSLLEMDGAPVFNAAHLLGLFTTPASPTAWAGGCRSTRSTPWPGKSTWTPPSASWRAKAR